MCGRGFEILLRRAAARPGLAPTLADFQAGHNPWFRGRQCPMRGAPCPLRTNKEHGIWNQVRAGRSSRGSLPFTAVSALRLRAPTAMPIRVGPTILSARAMTMTGPGGRRAGGAVRVPTAAGGLVLDGPSLGIPFQRRVGSAAGGTIWTRGSGKSPWTRRVPSECEAWGPGVYRGILAAHRKFTVGPFDFRFDLGRRRQAVSCGTSIQIPPSPGM